MTTYDELQEAWKRELHNPELQPLRSGFFKELSSYIKRLIEAQKNLDAKSLKAVVMEEEILRLGQLLTQFLDRRLDKLWLLASLVESTGLEYTEKLAHQAISGILRDYDKMKQALLKAHGPFHKEDVARLPQENADSLIRQGTAVEVTASNRDNE